MKFIIDYILGLFKSEKPGEVVTVEETPKVEPAPKAEAKPKKEEVTKPEPKMTKSQLTKLTKKQLEEKGREVGVELDLRKKKADLVNELHKQLK